MKIGYSIKYVLTDGILKKEGVEVDGYLKGGSYTNGTYFFEKIGKDVFLTAEEAREAAKKKIVSSIKSLEKKINKLQKLLFEI